MPNLAPFFKSPPLLILCPYFALSGVIDFLGFGASLLSCRWGSGLPSGLLPLPLSFHGGGMSCSPIGSLALMGPGIPIGPGGPWGPGIWPRIMGPMGPRGCGPGCPIIIGPGGLGMWPPGGMRGPWGPPGPNGGKGCGPVCRKGGLGPRLPCSEKIIVVKLS